MAGDTEEDKPIKLDNAGTLNQSVSTSLLLEKVSLLPGHEPDLSAATFCITHEDHTLGNALRWMIMKDPDVEFCGYNLPHPSEPKVHLRVQMHDNLSSVDCLRKALNHLRDLLIALDQKYGKSLRNDKYIKEEDPDVRAVVEATLRERGRLPEDDGEDGMDTS